MQHYNPIRDFVKPEIVFVEGGTFKMGSDESEEWDDEKPKHNVTLSSFYVSKYVITVQQYRAFCNETGYCMPDTPTWGWNDNHPIVLVFWDDAVAYCTWLGQKYGGEWQLPTEAQWEFAALGGNMSKGYKFSGSDDPETVAWYKDNSDRQINIIGKKKPNELGLHDMSGNVWEWCRDWYAEDYYKNSQLINPEGPLLGYGRVVRGGGWFNPAEFCRITYRKEYYPGDHGDILGFRVVFSQ